MMGGVRYDGRGQVWWEGSGMVGGVSYDGRGQVWWEGSGMVGGVLDLHGTALSE